MNFLPIVQRELIVRARRPGPHWTRWTVAALAALVTLQVIVTLGGGATGAQSAGQWAYSFLLWLAGPLVVAAGLLTADALTAERREGTLGLLFLTDLRGYDIVLGKLASHGLGALYALLALAPALTVTLLAGGVTGGEILRATFGLLALLGFALAAGLWASAGAPQQAQAFRNALGLTAAAALGPLLIGKLTAADGGSQFLFLGVASLVFLGAVAASSGWWIWVRRHAETVAVAVSWTFVPVAVGVAMSAGTVKPVSLTTPLFPLMAAGDARLAAWGGAYWQSLMLVGFEVVVLLALASRRLAATWRDDAVEPVGGAEARATAGKVAHQPVRAGAGGDPIAWLVSQLSGLRSWLWLAGALAGSFPLALTFTGRFFGLRFLTGAYYAGSLTSAVIFAWMGSRFFQEARRSGLLEVLLSTPVGASDVVRGQWRALRRALIGPLILCVAPGIISWWNLLILNSGRPAGGGIVLLLHALSEVANTVLRPLALVWVGMWFGLRMRRPVSAVGWTLALVAVAPQLAGLGWHLAVRLLFGAVLFAPGLQGVMNFIFYDLVPSLFGPVVSLLFIRWAACRLSGDLRVATLAPPLLSARAAWAWVSQSVRRLRHWTPG